MASIEVPLHDPRLSVIHYIGKDTFLLPFLRRMIPPHKCYVEVFGGGAALLLNKPPSPVEVYNDIDGNLVNLFRIVRERPAELLEKFNFMLVSREEYYTLLHKLQRGEIEDPVERAAAFLYVGILNYAGRFGGGLGFGPKRNAAQNLWSVIARLKLVHRRLKNVIIERLDFREVIKRYDGEQTFFYCDPPHLYIGTEKGRDYYAENGFTDKDYMDLLSLLEKAKGKWLLKQASEIPWLLDWAKERGFNIERVELTKSARANPRTQKRERYICFFIANYKLRNQAGGKKKEKIEK